MNYSVLIIATGKNTSKGIGYHKAFHRMHSGVIVLDKTLDVFMKDPKCVQVVIVTNPVDMDKISHKEDGRLVRVNGGSTRLESVLNGLMAVSEDVVLIHDGVRPWVRQELIDDLLESAITEKAVVPMVKVKENVKKIKNGYVVCTLDRDHLFMTQTPQAFHTDFIIDCYNKAFHKGLSFVDDSQVVENVSDQPIKVIRGSYYNTRVIVKDNGKYREDA